MKRIPEPELMNNEKQVAAYSQADFSSSNNLFIEYIINKINISNFKSLKILDLGCGPCDIDIHLVKLFPNCKIFAVDGSEEMLKVAQKKIIQNNLTDKIILLNYLIPDIKINTIKFDLIISKDLLHHLKNPEDLWKTIDNFSHENTKVFIMDLIRPKNIQIAKSIVEKVSGKESEILKIDFFNSLLASYTIKEVKDMLINKNYDFNIEKIGDRHFIISLKKLH